MTEQLDDSARRAVQKRATGMNHADAVAAEAGLRDVRQRQPKAYCLESAWRQNYLDCELAEWQRLIRLLSEDGFGVYSPDKDPAVRERTHANSKDE
ncbi:hypothetical protein [Streptomyces sp. AC512_CC834]|uniref:hypothetical protein n=1 Tax=Streptomyces sp. AC512_CC834 TaxID=2823691 RepID=UPI001C27C5E3|nr:hypothetical protein [Streptomyces sp. AC512_CC834]